MLRTFLVAGLLLFSLQQAATAQSRNFLNQNPTYTWPTDASRYASSSFGETRAGHFHAALDIKTWGRKGYKVFATRDGELFRVGVSAVGYGNVVYLKHDDGSFSVYAHLMAFTPRIRKLVDSLRIANDYSFELDRVVENQHIHFKAGDVIGFTGATGVGPPHLHYELRTPSNHPFNPLLTNITIRDHRAPRFSGLSVEPLSADATVEGKKHILQRRPRHTSKGYTFGTVDVTGTVGLGVDAFDQADNVSNVYAVYQLKLLKDGETLFHTRVDSFSYKETDQMFLDRVYPILKKTREGYQRLYLADGNTLPFYSYNGSRGKLRLPPGSYKLTIEASDFFGNTTPAFITLRVHEAPKPAVENVVSPSLSIPDTARRIPESIVDSWYWNDNWVATANGYPADTLRLGSLGSYHLTAQEYIRPEGSAGIPLDRIHSQRMTLNNNRQVVLHRIAPGKASEIYTPDNRAWIRFGPQTFYDTLSVGLVQQKLNGTVKLHLFPGHDPMHKEFKLHYLLSEKDESDSRIAFYYYHQRKQKLFYIPTKEKGHELIGEAKWFGTYYIKSDTTAPTADRPRLYRREDGQWMASVHVDDNLAGVDFHRAKIYMNGQRGIPEYDPEHDRIHYYLPGFKPQKQNTLHLILPDMVGNRFDGEFRLDR